MKKADKFKPYYKKQLLDNIPCLTTYLETKTSYKISIDVVMDKNLGWIYKIGISTDSDFSATANWLIYSVGKISIKEELLANIAHFDIRNKKLGGSTQKITRRTSSTALKTYCYKCNDEIGVLGVHRNLLSPMFADHDGYAYICNKCLHEHAATIARDKSHKAGILFLCCLLDRPYITGLVNELVEKNIDNTEKLFGLYFRRLNLYKGVKGKRCTFSDSDIEFE